MDEMIELEVEARERVSRSLSKIEVALADWEHSKKPKDLSGQVEYLKRSHTLFSQWMRKSLQGKKDEESAKTRLKEFAELCRELKVK